jgi:hypothetical protein
MKAVVFRPIVKRGSWRPRSIGDMRGPWFPEEYRELMTLSADSVEHACEQFATILGDVIFLGSGINLVVYATAPFGWEMVKFGRQWRSPVEWSSQTDCSYEPRPEPAGLN